MWTGATAEKSGGWKIENGILSNEPPTYNPISKEKFKDFKIETEFKLDEKQNSGLYLRGRYELQLALGAGNPLTQGRQGFLAIYGWKATDVDAAKPAGEWQSLEAIVVGNRLTAEDDADVAWAFAHMNPMAWIAVDRHALLRDIALHD